MAIDALAIPFDITWQRVAWQTDMLDRGYDNEIPPKWRSSISAYAYTVPLEETALSYPDHRVVYVKVTTSITGWSPRECLSEYLRRRDPSLDDGGYGNGGSLPPLDEDDVQTDGWDNVEASDPITRNYWPCGAALLQVSIFPNPEVNVPDHDYPSIIDFEPKKRELYEAVTETNEVLSGSQSNTNIRKGSTSTTSNEISAGGGFSVPLVGSASASASRRWGSEEVDITTTDSSTERRETAGRSTQLSQMYQLFNAYHVGTNRAVFLSFPRPNIVSTAEQIENSLASGDRGLEGIQDVFLIVLVPKTSPGFCVRAGLDTSHKTAFTNGETHYITTRRAVRGCANFQGDRIIPLAPPSVPPRPPVVVGEGEAAGWDSAMEGVMKSGRPGRISVADSLNLGAAALRRSILATQAAGNYKPRPFAATATFRRIVTLAMRSSKTTFGTLLSLNYLTAAEQTDLGKIAITNVTQLFAETDPSKVSTLVATIRDRLVEAIAGKALV